MASKTLTKDANHYPNHYIHNPAKSRRTQIIKSKLRTQEREQGIIVTMELREKGT